jgi:peroxiredoxin
MKHSILAAALLAASVACTKPTTPAPAKVEAPSPAPAPTPQAPAESFAIGREMLMKDTEMKNVDGTMVSIQSAAKEKGTLVIFSCNHCPYVIAWEDRLVAMGNEALEKGIGTIAINSNDPNRQSEDSFEAMKTRAAAKGMKFPYVVDETSAVARAYGASKTPEVYLFDAGGKLVYHGAIDDNAEDAAAVKTPYLRQAIDAMLAGQPIPMAETKALGCSIKFRGA